MVAVAKPGLAIVEQLDEWGAKNGVLFVPRVYPFSQLTGTLAAVTKQVQPDGGFVCFALVGLSFDQAANRVQIANVQTGGRKLVDGTLRLAAFQDALESDGIGDSYLPAPIVVLPSDYLTYELACEVAGETFANGTGNNYQTAALGYALHYDDTGTQMNEVDAREKLVKLLEDLGEFRALGVEGVGTGIDVSASPMKAMSCEVIAAQGMAPTGTTNARLTLGTYEIIPPALSAPQTLLAFRAPSVVLNPNTRVQMRTSGTVATARAHVAILGRSLGC